MDQLTHTVRRSNWINIIRQCQDRPAGTTAKQWLAENDILGFRAFCDSYDQILEEESVQFRIADMSKSSGRWIQRR